MSWPPPDSFPYDADPSRRGRSSSRPVRRGRTSRSQSFRSSSSPAFPEQPTRTVFGAPPIVPPLPPIPPLALNFPPGLNIQLNNPPRVPKIPVFPDAYEPAPITPYFFCERCTCWFSISVVSFIIAFSANLAAAVSLPFLYYTAGIVDVNFNPAFSGTLGGRNLINLQGLRFGIWAACYSANDHSHECFDAHIAYQVSLTTDGGTNNLGTSILTFFMAFQGLAAVATFAVILPLLRCKWLGFLSSLSVICVAIIFTIAATVVNYLLFLNIASSAEKLGGVTKLGSGFATPIAALLFLIVIFVINYFVRKKAGKLEKKYDKIEENRRLFILKGVAGYKVTLSGHPLKHGKLKEKADSFWNC